MIQTLHLLYDTERFSQMFAGERREHPLHIRPMTLPTTPRSTKIFQNNRTVDVELLSIGRHSYYGSMVMKMWFLLLHSHKMAKKLCQGMGDMTIRVWDTSTGAETAYSQLRGHTAAVYSAEF